ncbi:MAG: cupredoxin domain-containing protein [Methanomassiliicoccus sp.]|nr:cupredoxin domain-containing protein [Methanomassiliicoccus sp.]
MDRRVLAVIAVAAVVIIVIVAIMVMQTPPGGNGNEQLGGNMVDIRDFSFDPGTLTVANGTTVTWTNLDSFDHTVTFDNGPFISSELMSRGEMFNVTFDRSGTYNYHCSIHPSMTGTIVVE